MKQTETTKAKENEELQTELNQVRNELKEAKIMIEQALEKVEISEKNQKGIQSSRSKETEES